MKKIVIVIVICLVGNGMLPAFETTAQACGGWWDPCCGGSWSEDRCAAFNQRKRDVAAQNEAYFYRMGDRLSYAALAMSWAPYAGAALGAAATAAYTGARKSGAVARGETPNFVLVLDNNGQVSYVATGYEWPDNLSEDAEIMAWYADYAVMESNQFRVCMSSGGDSSCQINKNAANEGLWYVGAYFGEMAYDSDVLANELDYWYGESDGSAALREIATMSRSTEWEYQQ